jgi:uncharacterized phiE125 gp8 family phage protein
MGVFIEPPFWSSWSDCPPPAHMRSVVVTPSVPVLTRAQGKTYAGLDWLDGDARDALMDNWILSAQRKVEQDTGVALLTQTIDVYLDALPSDRTPIDLPWRPITAITSVKYTDSGGTQQTLDPTNYLYDGASAAPIAARIALSQTGLWPSDLRFFQPYVIRLVAGYADVTALQAAAPELFDAVGLLVGHAANTGRDRYTNTAQLRDEYDEKIAPYRLVAVA